MSTDQNVHAANRCDFDHPHPDHPCGRRVGRPTENAHRVTTAVRFPDDLHAVLKAEAKARTVSVNWLVNAACWDYVDRLLPVGEAKWTRDQ